MQTVNTGNHPGRASTFFMSMIDLKSKTATLWIQYMKMVEICLQFLKAECTGDLQASAYEK